MIKVRKIGLDENDVTQDSTTSPVEEFGNPIGRSVSAAADGTGYAAASDTPAGSLVNVSAFVTAALQSLKSGELRVFDTQLAALYFQQSPIADQMVSFTSTVQQNTFYNVGGKDYVVIDASADNGDGAALLAELVKIGLQGGASFGKVASGYLPTDQVAALKDVAHLAYASETPRVSYAGAVTTQADAAEHADDARASFGVNGNGVKVGILSNSFNHLGGAATGTVNGDLPAGGVQIIQDSNASNDTDEGRAMAELIHDLAPNAALAFATANGGQANFANNIIALSNAGANVIVDDVRYFAEPAYQDGVIAQAVNQVVSAGKTYFSAAGDVGHNGWEAAYSDSGVDATFGGFPENLASLRTGANAQFLPVTVLAQATVTIVLHWDQPSNSVSPGHSPTNDLDLGLYNPAGTALVASSLAANPGGDPIEMITFTNTASTFQIFNIAVGLFSGAAPTSMKIVVYNGALGASSLNTNDGTVVGHAAASGSISVGAVRYTSTPEFGHSPVPEGYSSVGDTRIFYDTAGNRVSPSTGILHQSPILIAVDGGNTSFFGQDDSSDADSFPNFYGSSAAAADAAAVAALMLDLNPTLTPTQIQTILTSTALDFGAAGTDRETGAGLINAAAALSATSSYTISDTLPTPFLVNGKAAVLWHNDNGILHGWTLDNTPARTGGVNIGPNPGAAWHFKTSADFNGDGKADFLFQNDDSTAHVWTMDGLTRTGGFNIGPLPGAAWHIKDAADFNGDGKTDILFQNDDSTVHVWTMDGLTRTGGFNVGPVPGAAWHVIDARDLSGDGKTDILFQNDNGQLHVWTMNGLTRTAGVDVGPNPGPTWHIKAIADFTGDHKPDILWQNDNSTVHVWTMDGVTRTGGFNVGPVPGLAWHVKEAADYNGDGKTDILFQNDSGALHVWIMDGLTRTAGIDIPPNQTADWHVLA